MNNLSFTIFEHGVGITDPYTLDEQIAYLRTEVMPANRVRVAKQNGTIVAFLASNPESIAQLHVRVPKHRLWNWHPDASVGAVGVIG